jgi:Imelysin
MTFATEVRIPMTRLALAAACAFALALAACGNDDSQSEPDPPAAKGTDLAAIKDYLLEHTEQLVTDSGAVRQNAEDYHKLAKSTDFDYGALLEEHRAEVRSLVEQAQDGFAQANPAYEQMEGVVAGVPSLADYDVIIDAGSDASDPENAVPFDLKTPAGREFKQPGNFNYLIETSIFGTEPKFRAKGVEPDLDGDGKVEFGEAAPDADFYVAAARGFEKYAKELDAAAREWEPTPADALTALVVMTPTMSEYFEAWKNSRFIAGDKATEKAFVVASRLQDIADILGGLVLVYDNVKPLVARADAQQAEQTEQSLTKLHAFAAQLRDKEAGGRKYTAEEADTLGSQAQERAEAIAGQITQAAAKLNIEIQEG